METSELDLRTSCNMEHLAASTSSLERNVIDMMQHLGGHSGATERHLLALDARMQTMQQMLEHSIIPQRRTFMPLRSRRIQLQAPRHVSQITKKPELPGSRILSRRQEPGSESVRLIYPAFLVYEKDGKAHTELVALNSGDLNRLDVAQKSRMIQYLQSLRLLLWLLKRENYLTTNSTKDLGLIRSSLAVQAGITSFWEFSNAFSDLATSLDASPITTLSWLPWLKNKAWLQYVFNRILDRRDGEEVMELVLKRWPSFPLPDDEVGKYTLSIPAQLLRDRQVQEIWNSYAETSIWDGALNLAVEVCHHNVLMMLSCESGINYQRPLKSWPIRRTAKCIDGDCADELGVPKRSRRRSGRSLLSTRRSRPTEVLTRCLNCGVRMRGTGFEPICAGCDRPKVCVCCDTGYKSNAS